MKMLFVRIYIFFLNSNFLDHRLKHFTSLTVTMRPGMINFVRFAATASVRTQRVYAPSVGAQVW